MASKNKEKQKISVASRQPPVVERNLKPTSAEGAAQIAPQAKRVMTVCIVVILGLILSLLYHRYQVVNLEKDFYPFNTFLFNPADRFNDFNNIFKASVDLDPFSYSVSVYFPFTYLVMHGLNFFDISVALLIFNMSFVAFFLVYLYRNLPLKEPYQKILAAFVLSALTYPFLFLVDRGNLEAWGFMAIAMFILCYLKKKDLWSVVFLSIATSFKLYPALLGLLFLIDRKYLLLVYTAVMTGIVGLGSAAVLKGGITGSIAGQLKCLSGFSKVYISSTTQGLHHSSSIFAPLKLLYYNVLATTQNYPAGYEKAFNTGYFFISLSFFLLVLFLLLRYEMQLWKRVSLLILTFILLPQVSYDYKLISIFIPLILFINTVEIPRFNGIYTILFGLILIPKDYIIIADDLSVSSVLNPIIIFSLMVLIAIEVVQSKLKLKWRINAE